VDASVCEARKTVSLAVENTLEWGTPVLYMRSPDGMLFDLAAPAKPVIAPAPGAPLPATVTTAPLAEPVPEAVIPIAPQTARQAEPLPAPRRSEEAESPAGKILDRWVSRPLSVGWLAIILVIVVGCFFLAWRLLPVMIAPSSDTPTPPPSTSTLAVATNTEAILLPTSPPATDTVEPTEIATFTPTEAPAETTAPAILEETGTDTPIPPTPTIGTPPRLGLSGDCLNPAVWFPFPTMNIGSVTDGCLVMDDFGILLESGRLYIQEKNEGAERVIGIYAPLSGDAEIELDLVIDELDTPSEDELSNLSLGILPDIPTEPPVSGLIYYQREAPAATLYPIFIKSSERGGYNVYYRSGSDYMRYKTGANQHLYFRLQNGRYYLSLNGESLIQSASLKGDQPVFWIGYRMPSGGLISARIFNFVAK
jgi:hypothetical protein